MNPTDMVIRVVSLIILLVLFVVPSALAHSAKFPQPFKMPKDTFSLFFSKPSSSEQQVDVGPRLINTRVGKQQISAIMDTSNDLIWAICVTSNNTSHFYNPSNSSTFTNISCGACPSFVNHNCFEQCNYNDTDYDIGIDTWETYGYLVKDNVNVGANSTEITFGCVSDTSDKYSKDYNNHDIYGVLGFGNGNLSLIRQLGHQRFSYCLPANATEATTVKFDTNAVITGKESQSIQLITHTDDIFYHVNLTQITVGTTTVTLNTSMNYETIMDTYDPYLYLDNALYNSTRDAFLNEMGLSIIESNDSVQALCFNKALIMPSLVLQFDGSVNVTLERSAYVVKHQKYASNKCLSIYPMANNNGYNILGNLIQVDKNMVFDLEKKILSFEKAKCTSSAKAFIPSGGLGIVVLLFSFLVM